MNLNRIDWPKTQKFFVDLLLALKPFAERENESVSFLNKRFFIPPFYQNDSQIFRFRHPVSLLKTTLHTAQEQVAEWIEQLPPVEPEDPAAAKKEELPLLQPTGKAKPEEQSLTMEKGETASPSRDQKPNRPFSLQAQRLIDQVREAIGTLCTSSNINDLRAAPLREALKRLKPLIDEIVEAVSQEGMHSADDEPNPQTRLPVPSSPREHLMKKLIPLPLNTDRKAQNEEQKLPNAERLTNTERKRGDVQKSGSLSPLEREEILRLILQKPSISPDQSGDTQSLAQPHKEGVAPRSLDRISLPGAPFIPESRSLTPVRKKKKRKGFWFREEKEDQPNS